MSDFLDANEAHQAGRLPKDPLADAQPCDDDNESAPTPDLPPFPLECFPPELAQLVRDYSDWFLVAPEMAALPMLGALAMSLGPRFKVRGKGMEAAARAWFLLVARSGQGKTPTAKAVLTPIGEFDKQLREEFERESAEFARQEKSRKKDPNRADPAAPIRQPYLLTDATPEALLQRLATAKEHALILAPDEGRHFFAVLDGYRKTSGLGRTVILQLWGDGAVRQARKDKPPIEIDDPFLIFSSGIQPSVLGEVGFASEDGLFPRFLTAHASEREEEQAIGEEPEGAQRRWAEFLSFAREVGNEAQGARVLTEELADFFDGICCTYKRIAREQSEQGNGLLGSMYAKASEHFLRFVALLHGAEVVAARVRGVQDPPGPTQQTLDLAEKLLEYFLLHGAHTARLVLSTPPKVERNLTKEERVLLAGFRAILSVGDSLTLTPSQWLGRLNQAGAKQRSSAALGKALTRLKVSPLKGLVITQEPRGANRSWTVKRTE